MARQDIFNNNTSMTGGYYSPSQMFGGLYSEPYNRVPLNDLARGLKPYGFTPAGVAKKKPSDEMIRQMAIQAVIKKYQAAFKGK